MKNSAFRSLGYLGRGEASEGNTWRDGSAGHFHDRRSGWREDRSGRVAPREYPATVTLSPGISLAMSL
jgi:hypothetical protein